MSNDKIFLLMFPSYNKIAKTFLLQKQLSLQTTKNSYCMFLILFAIWESWMMVYMKSDINQKRNPLTTIITHKKVKQTKFLIYNILSDIHNKYLWRLSFLVLFKGLCYSTYMRMISWVNWQNYSMIWMERNSHCGSRCIHLRFCQLNWLKSLWEMGPK